MNGDGRKIQRKYENFIDNILIDINQHLNPVYKNIGFTPNILTLISLLITVYGLYLYHNAKCNKSVVYFAVFLYFVGYYFDCADGNMARAYNMTSVFGDLFDHISDLFKFILTIYILYKTVSKKQFYRYLGILTVLIFIMSIQFGCQELFYKQPNESAYLNIINLCKFSKNPESTIQITKWFGGGTIQIIICIILLHAKLIRCHSSKKLR